MLVFARGQAAYTFYLLHVRHYRSYESEFIINYNGNASCHFHVRQYRLAKNFTVVKGNRTALNADRKKTVANVGHARYNTNICGSVSVHAVTCVTRNTSTTLLSAIYGWKFPATSKFS